MHRLPYLLAGAITVLAGTIGQAGCCDGGSCCPVSYPDATVAAAVVPLAIIVSSQNVLNISGSNAIFLYPNAIYMQFTVGGQPITLPVLRYGCSYMYFCHVPNPLGTLAWDGWTPIVFNQNDPLLSAYFACNSLPVIPRPTREAIAALIFPISCSASRHPCVANFSQ